MQSFLTIYVAAATLVTALLALAGIHARRSQPRELWPPATDHVTCRPTQRSDPDQAADVREAATIALNRLLAPLRDRSIRVDVAIRPGLLVRQSEHRLADTLE